MRDNCRGNYTCAISDFYNNHRIDKIITSDCSQNWYKNIKCRNDVIIIKWLKNDQTDYVFSVLL